MDEKFFFKHLKLKMYNYFLTFFLEIEEREKVIKSPVSPTKVPEEQEVVLRRTHSFETDEK